VNFDIVNDFREYQKNPAKWVDRYLDQCSPNIRRTELTDEEFDAMVKASKEGTLKIKIH
jgi:hypothetical protein